MCRYVVNNILCALVFFQMMNSMGGDDLPDLDGAEEEVLI